MSSLQGWEGYGVRCSISEFIGCLQNPDFSSKQNLSGWVFWNLKIENELQKNAAQVISFPTTKEGKIRRVLEEATSNLGNKNLREYVVQFWAMKEGFLTTVDQPFAVVGSLYKGQCWYRKLCEAHQYLVNEEVSEEEAGSVGRVYLKGYPESSPDLRLYSINEFPLRNEAERCGLRSYLAMPVFDKQCYGVLEIVSPQIGLDSIPIFSLVDEGFKKAGLMSTHITLHKSLHPESEIQKMMISATELVPQLHLVQVWSPCNHINTSNNLSCMHRVALRNPRSYVNCIMDQEMLHYLHACEFHCLQIGKWIGSTLMSADRKSCFCRNICDFSICENPLAHYAQRARLSFCFVVHLQNVNHSNKHHLIEFFFQLNACDTSFLHMLLKIMEKELKNFKFEKSIVELRKTSALTMYEYVEWKHHQHLHTESSFPDFKKYVQIPVLSCLQLFLREDISDSKVNNNTALPNILMQEKIKKLMMEITTNWVWSSYSLVQFWAVGMNGERPYLRTSDQPFAFASLHKALAIFRKQCMEIHYFMDEEVGPLQRVFRNGHPEISPDLRLYSITEFPLRNHAIHYLLRKYIAFPILDQHKKCIGVLEYFGIDDDDEVGIICSIERALEEASLGSTHISFMARPTRQVDPSRHLADTEIFSALNLLKNIPQLFHTAVWVTYKECDGISSSISCMEPSIKYVLGWPVTFRPIQTGKGTVGAVLLSKYKLCFCRNLCSFSIAEEPLAHYLQRDRVDVCFAICLQSSHTGDLVYVLQFFLFQGPAKIEYLYSFLRILFPILRQQLTSFKVASGKQLTDDLLIDVFKHPQQNQLTNNYVVPNVMNSVPSIPRAKPSNTATSDSSEKEKLGRKRNGSLEDLQPHFGKETEHVAEELGVGSSTIKRSCSEKYIKNRSLFEAAGTSQRSRSSNLPSPDMSLLTDPPQTYAETTLQPVTELHPASETVMVTAKYEDEIIKFKLCLSSTMNKLLEEVARRLDFEIGSFKLRYLDEDNDKVLLACDDDLQFCLKSLSAGGKTTMQVFVHLISK